MTKKQTQDQEQSDYAAEEAAEQAAEAKYPTGDGAPTGTPTPTTPETYDEEVPARFSTGGASLDEIEEWKKAHCVKPGYEAGKQSDWADTKDPA